jgi:hypothetical protein
MNKLENTIIYGGGFRGEGIIRWLKHQQFHVLNFFVVLYII